jgi:glycosyltransferase involved in cell wall biosynthesis
MVEKKSLSNELNFKVSVIMPVYNAEKYVEEAVHSAVHLDHVGEIILIEDGSKDESLQLCKRIAEDFDKIQLFTHENNVNKGASESRNLGIQKAKFDYISFLDADDIYTENRFTADATIFLENLEIDGVYSVVDYINEPDGKKFTLTKVIKSSQLLHYLLRGTYGHFCTLGITVRKSIFEKVGCFNSKLILHQDTEMWLRMSSTCILVAGELNTRVASIRRHEGNRIWKGQNNATKVLMYQSFLDWAIQRKISNLDLLILVKKIAGFESKLSKTPFLWVFFKKTVQVIIMKYFKAR